MDPDRIKGWDQGNYEKIRVLDDMIYSQMKEVIRILALP